MISLNNIQPWILALILSIIIIIIIYIIKRNKYRLKQYTLLLLLIFIIIFILIKYLQDGKSFNLLNSHKGGKADDAVLQHSNEIDTSIPTF